MLDGKAPQALLDTYSEERTFAADENILNSTRSTDFITPKSSTSRLFRNAVLELARDHAFARALVNSGRLSVAAYLTESRLNTPDSSNFAGDMVPGAAMDDAPLQEADQDLWLLDQIGNHFAALVYVQDAQAVAAHYAALAQTLAALPIPVELVLLTPQAPGKISGVRVLHDHKGRFAERYDAQAGTCYLLRPDQHVAARWRAADASAIQAALARATLNPR